MLDLTATADPSTTPGNRILLVDDHDLARRALVRLLSAVGYDVTDVADGTQALRALEVGPEFDYLLTDVRLPDLDGREIVRAAQGHDPRPLIALITGWDIEPEECDRLGIDWLFLKPVDVRDLVAKLASRRA